MRAKRRPIEIQPPFVSLADVAFNLVLFFVILAKVKDDRQIEWTPAQAAGAKTVGKPKASIVIDRDKKIYVNGVEIGVRDLAASLEKDLANVPPGERLVLLKIDKDAPAATFEPVFEAVSQAGGEMAHVLKEPPKQ
jgi:biopolymer transport protein ExbD